MQFSAGECKASPRILIQPREQSYVTIASEQAWICLNLFNPEAIVKACEVLQHGCSVHAASAGPL